ncbi:MAG: YbjN domain-containing protein, partial [Anaeroplasmataceae bacterium]|nr:YbjN domain-containing protein [Anaeroplasmataceae bacterium]
MLYPYVSIEAGVCSMNVNIAKCGLKGFNYEKLNEFNRKSKFFKCFLTEEGILTLEYRFLLDEINSTVFDSIIESLYLLEFDIDSL